MEIISMILLAIVLVAQIVLFVLYFLEKRYVNHRFSAMLQYTDRRINECDSKDDVMDCVDDVLDAFGEKINERFKRQNEVIGEFQNAVNDKVDRLALDYSTAQEAANKVNDYASSLASIFDYDPIKAVQRGRKKEAR
jgi:hypothetical protein